ncbi:MAG: diphthine--ammonia ligase [Desulfobulbus sp.]|nr:MAG: diphthine--ammonia ligase [Desulfobulbus sp.]
MEALNNRPFFSSWSGGKDSCLALYRAIRQGGRPGCLFTMFAEDGRRSKSHGLSSAIIQAQARAMAIPFRIGRAGWDGYEQAFLGELEAMKREGIGDGVFGDIDLAVHREWVERVCASRAVAAHLPLWQCARRELLAEFIAAGFRALIVVVDRTRLGEEFLGRELDARTVADLEGAGVDACGEEGEYHSLVIDGPLFTAPLPVRAGAILRRERYSFLEIGLESEAMGEGVGHG